MAGKLGALPTDRSRFIPRLERYVTGAIRATGLPPARGNIDRSSKVTSWPMYSNGPDDANAQVCPGSPEGCGDCVWAALGHMIQGWSTYSAATTVTIPSSEIIRGYASTGYDPATGENDNGTDPSVALDYLRSTGYVDATSKIHKVAGYAMFGDPTDEQLLAQVLEVFGTVFMAFNLPESALSQFDNGQPWDASPGSPIAGGHMVCLQRRAVGGTGVLRYISWGREQRTTRAFQSAYASEAFAVVSSDWIRANGTTVEGLNLTQLLSDMSYV